MIHIENTEGYTWIGTDLRELDGVRHLLHSFGKIPNILFIEHISSYANS